jgi:hypothetical protein
MCPCPREPNKLRAPTILLQVRRKDTQALLDTGSIVTLLRPDLAGGRRGEPMEVTCVHGDTATYETCYAEAQTPRGMFTARAGVVPRLPAPVIIGRDCPIFHRLWNPKPEYRPPRNTSHRQGRVGRPAYGARVPLSIPSESSAEEDGSDGDDPILPSTPARSTGGTPRAGSREPDHNIPETQTATEPTGPPRETESSPLTSSRISTRQGEGERIGPGSSPTLNYRTTT